MAFYTTQLLGKPSKIKTTSFVTNVKKNLVEAEVIIIIIELNAKPVLHFSPVNEDIEAPDDAGDGDHVEGDGAAQLPSLHPRHVQLLPLSQWLDLNSKIRIQNQF